MIADHDRGAADGKAAGRARTIPPILISAALLLACLSLAAGCLSGSRPGSLTVTSDPSGAEVSVGGRYAGTTPLEITNLTPGPYTLRLRLGGYADREFSVTVTAGNRTAVTARYPPPLAATPTPSATLIPPITTVPTTPILYPMPTSPAPGSLFLTSSPEGAAVSVNGEGMGVTPVLLRNLTPGTYAVRFSLVGWRDYQVALSVSSGQMTTEEATLKR